VAENIYLGREPGRFGALDRAAMHAGAVRWLRRFECRFSARQLAGSLSIAEQQIVEIAKAVNFNASTGARSLSIPLLLRHRRVAMAPVSSSPLVGDVVARLGGCILAGKGGAPFNCRGRPTRRIPRRGPIRRRPTAAAHRVGAWRGESSGGDHRNAK
jgi:hypothetical protein